MPNGFEAGLYRNVGGTYESPTWVLFGNVMDLDCPDDPDEIAADIRANAPSGAVALGLDRHEITFNMLVKPDDTDYVYVRDKRNARESFDCMVVSADKDSPGDGWRAEVVATKFSRTQPINGLQAVSVALKPWVWAAHKPEKVVIAEEEE